jgi:hypothetical protein
MPERKDLGVHRIAHQVQPWARNVGVVPHLLSCAAIGDELVERFIVPEVGMREDHRNGLEVAPTGRALQTRRQLGKRAGARRDDLLVRGGMRGAGGKRSGSERQ